MTSKVSRALRSAGTRDAQPAPNVDPCLRILMLEDNADDAELQRRALSAAGLHCTCERVDTERAYKASLESGAYDVVLSDYSLPSFVGLRALQILRDRKPDVPFILVSGALGEEAAIESLK